MKVLVDTCVWSRLFRRSGHEHDPIVMELAELIKDYRAQIMGPIRQEILSGIKNMKQYTLLRDHLRAFTDLVIMSEDYEAAAEMNNRCRRKGIQGSHIDFVICAVAKRNDLSIFTLDGDFAHYKPHVQIKLYRPTRRV